MIGRAGRGHYGTVHVLIKQGGEDDGTTYAMKDQPAKTDAAETELRTLQDVTGVPYQNQLHYAFESNGQLSTVVEYSRYGTVGDRTRDRKFGVSVGVVRMCMAELLVAVLELYRAGYVHGGVHVENILVVSGGHIGLADYGKAESVDKGKNCRNHWD
ncbi:hypothetical protein PR048_006354 [Dryococelus australis]|uniref:Protein kinase domain-containing protein n=1 Tax=Dryococelus australis TaxID=614101 RepID=A0ABQ9IBZ6_9NEOP|nr:hypothetical protein PR048_006354 [Dryococelus australis]